MASVENVGRVGSLLGNYGITAARDGPGPGLGGNVAGEDCGRGFGGEGEPGVGVGDTGKEQGWRGWLGPLRLVNGGLHAALCAVLLAIMGSAMRVLREDVGGRMGIQAIVLIIVLGLDAILDVVVLVSVRSVWPAWGVGLRSACGIAYFALFLVYVGLGGVFPRSYTYWGLSADAAKLPVYVLLCVLGLWNLLHIPACRCHFGGGRNLVRRNSSFLATDKRTSFNQPAVSMVGTERSSISLTWRRWVRTRSTQYSSRDDLENGLPRSGTPDHSADTTLRERPSEEEKEEGRMASEALCHGEPKSEEKSIEGEQKWKKEEGGMEVKEA
ncbi:hypothetical protein VTK26DRAFT_1036 [Humicola hyalothermophila]